MDADADLLRRAIADVAVPAVAIIRYLDQIDPAAARRARERYGPAARLVGFTTYEGTVTAASDRDAPAERKRVRPGLPGSWEDTLHSTGLERLLLALDDDPWGDDRSPISLLERAIGVIYRPETERLSHYVHAPLAAQFDALAQIDRTTAVQPSKSRRDGKPASLPRRTPPASERGADVPARHAA